MLSGDAKNKRVKALFKTCSVIFYLIVEVSMSMLGFTWPIVNIVYFKIFFVEVPIMQAGEAKMPR